MSRRSHLETLNECLMYLRQISGRFETSRPIEGTKQYVEEKVKLCTNNLYDLIAAEASREPEASSLSFPCLRSDGQTLYCDCRNCQTVRAKKRLGNNSDSLLFGQEREALMAVLSGSTGTTPATPDTESPAPTSLSEKRPTKLIYIAGPYWHSNPERRALHVASAKLLAVRVAEAGFFPICPHLNTQGFENLAELPETFYHAGDLLLLKACDAMILAQGHENSKGTQEEIKFATKHNMLCFRSIEDLEQYYASTP